MVGGVRELDRAESARAEEADSALSSSLRVHSGGSWTLRMHPGLCTSGVTL